MFMFLSFSYFLCSRIYLKKNFYGFAKVLANATLVVAFYCVWKFSFLIIISCLQKGAIRMELVKWQNVLFFFSYDLHKTFSVL